MYMNALIWKTQIKKVLKCSNISVKKYQNTPTLGVRSATDNLQNNTQVNAKAIAENTTSIQYFSY